jgi:hypothetical protein
MVALHKGEEARASLTKGDATKLRVTGIVLIALGAIVLVTPAGSALSQLVDDSSGPSAPTLAPGPAATGPPEPELSAAQQSRALELVAGDPALQRIVGNAPYDVTEIGPWGGENGEPLTGAGLRLQLAKPTSVDMKSWPVVDFRPAEDPPYSIRSITMGATGLRELQILVDLRSDQVVSIDPLEVAKIIPGPELTQAYQEAREKIESGQIDPEKAFGE